MIGALLLSSSFLILILIAVLYLAISIKRWSSVKDEELKEMNHRLDETQQLFKKEISQLLKNINNILPKNKDDRV